MPDCIVIGGGIIGLLTALELHKRGAAVLLMEKNKLGGESSWAGGGIIAPLFPWNYADCVNHLVKRSQKLYPELIDALLKETGVDSELLDSGMLILDKINDKKATAWAKGWGEKLEYLQETSALRAVEPKLNSCFTAGVWLPDVKQVRNPKFLHAIRTCFLQREINFQEESPIDQFIIEKSKIKGVIANSNNFFSEKVIVAGGAWSSELMKDIAAVNISPVKGQMILLKGKPQTVTKILHAQGHYLIPRKDGRILVGSTLEHTGFEKSISEDVRELLKRIAIDIVPELKNHIVERHWSGLRPGTVHGIPYICEHPEIEGLFIHAGHYRNGIVLGPASAELMADLVLRTEPGIDHEPFALNSVH